MCLNRFTLSILWILVFVGTCSFSHLHAAQVDDIVRRALKRDEEARKGRKKYLYDLTVEIQKLNRDGKVRGREKSQAVVEPQDQIYYPKYAEDAASEASDKKQMHDTQKRMAVMNLKKLAPRFKFNLAGTETVNGISCYVVRFSPKPNQPYDSKEEKVVNQLHGTFWIDQQHYSIIKSSGSLQKPVSVIALIAQMRELSFVYRTSQLPNGEFGPASFQLLYDVQTPVSYVRRRELSEMGNYRLKNKRPSSVAQVD